MKHLKLFAGLVTAFFIAGCATAPVVKEEKKAPAAEVKTAPAQDKMVLFDFEDPKEISGLYKENDDTRDYPVEQSTEHATSGKYSLKVAFPDKGSWPGPHFLEFPRDWSAFDVLKVDVFNPTKEIVKLAFAGADADAGFSEKNYFGEYSKRWGGERILKPGANTVEIDIVGLVVEDGSRAVNFKNMKRFALFTMTRPNGLVLYFDNIRVEKSKEE